MMKDIVSRTYKLTVLAPRPIIEAALEAAAELRGDIPAPSSPEAAHA